MLSKRDILRLAREREIRFVRLCFADILGIGKNVMIPVAQLERALEGEISFDGGSIDGFARGEEIDMLLRPDPATFAVHPWAPAEARLLCEVTTPDGEPFEGCPRTILRRTIEDTRAALPDLRIGLEVEFYLFELDENGDPRPTAQDAGGYFDLSASDRGEEARIAIVSALEAMGLSTASAHHEHGAGQHEIDFKETYPLAAADALMTMRSVARQVAARHGLHATFMPKPRETLAGSGVHIYFDFASDEETLFAIGGLLAHAPAFTAICNPTVNSYKRLVAAWDAPISASWSRHSADSLVRVPAQQGKLARIELRSADPSCNPYLAPAVLLASMAHGVREHTLPGDPLTGSTYELSERERAERRIRTLPTSLRQALDELDKDAIVRAALGDHIYHAFRSAKRAEYEKYRRAVHPWEREAYLRVY
jgi:glutamine synthetase